MSLNAGIESMSNADKDGQTEREEEDELQGQGVVRKYTLADLTPIENLRYEELPKPRTSSKGELPPYRQACPALLIGGSVFGKGIYSDDDSLKSVEPYRVVRLALQYGICAIDTSPYYHPSEISLGRILDTLKDEFPRQSYYIQTKVGRYGQNKDDFDYSPRRIRKSVQESLRRLNTTYLDSVVLHDTEFVCENVGPSQSEGFAARDLLDDPDVAHACGLPEVGKIVTADDLRYLGHIHGPGDEVVLDAARTLFELKDQGVVRNVGIGGYPIPVLLRLCRLIACTPPFRPVDVIVSYCHRTLQSDLLRRYEPLFAQDISAARVHAAGVAGYDVAQLEPWHAPTIINASPFSMGLLTDAGPPPWHPANDLLRTTTKEVTQHIQSADKDATLAAAAAQYGFPTTLTTSSSSPSGQRPTIVGMSTVEQVHQAMLACHINEIGQDQYYGRATQSDLLSKFEQQAHNVDYVRQTFKERNLHDWCWSSP